MSRIATTIRLGSRITLSHAPAQAQPIPPFRNSIRSISSTRSSFATPTTRPIRPSATPTANSNSPPLPNIVPESIYRRQTTTAALYLLSLLGALGAGYALNLIIDTPTPNIQYTLIDSAKAKQYQLENQPSYGSLKDYSSAINEIEQYFKSLGKEDKVSTDESDLESHGISDWSYHEEKRPTVVVWVESTEEVQEIVKIATRWRVPITPFSGGTSLEGHFSSPYGGISLDISLMDKILRLSVPDADVTLQPGVKWEDLNAYLKERDIPLFFPLDPGPGATIGGMCGTGCSGTNAVRYGTAKAEWFLNLTVVLPSGEVIKTRQRARKSSAGFDTTKLFIGAEGTLGIVTEATLRLAPLLPTKCAVVGFGGVEEAVAAATEIVNAGYPVQCVEFLDTRTMQAINQSGLTGRPYPLTDSLFLKFQGSDESMREVARGVEAVTKKHGGKGFEFSKTQKEAEALWAGRKAALWAVMGLKEDCKVWTTDVCVPISKLPQFVKETTKDFEDRGITACHLGHVGDGNVHSLALFTTPSELEVVKEAVHEMVYRAIELDGTCSGEHGVGLGKVEYLERELGGGTVGLMESIKRTVDPLNLMNPGKLYPNIRPIQPK